MSWPSPCFFSPIPFLADILFSLLPVAMLFVSLRAGTEIVTGMASWILTLSHEVAMLREYEYSVVQWHHYFSNFFWGGCPTKNGLSQKGSLFFQGHWTTESRIVVCMCVWICYDVFGRFWQSLGFVPWC